MRRVVLLVLAVLLAALGTGAVYLYVNGVEDRAAAQQTETTPVLVARENIPAGANPQRVVTSSRVVQVPRALVATGALTSPADIPAGAVLVDRLAAGQQVVASGFGARASNGIPAGQVQVSVEIAFPNRVADLIRPGDDVAVYVGADRAAALRPVVAPARVDSVVAAKNVVVFLVGRGDGEKIAQAGLQGDVVLLRLPGADGSQ